ncbi:SWI/SNF-related matrix-associated actin-dependent regulator of chromatin subfamily A-like protein 1, partial [Haematococcus lacustris]
MERYCRLDNWRKVVGSKNTDELNKLITGTFMIRRLKKDVLTQLPPKIRQQVSQQYTHMTKGHLRH